MKTITYAQSPVELPLRTGPEPYPAAGCGVCAALATQRRDARLLGDYSTVSDCNVELRNHPHPGEGA
ncbi:hypothetical protein EF910_37685 [Streptomyces sp. WAC07149]|nr:hypothetical protein EF910_37685 [Streptomyces sp. WAC07149]